MSGIHLDDGGGDHRGARDEEAFNPASSARVMSPGLGALIAAGSGSQPRIAGSDASNWVRPLRMADPGQDPRSAVEMDSLWLLFDTSPEGRGTDWRPSLTY